MGMGSLVPPSTDKFTSELCVFLSALANTSGTQFQSLTSQLVKLREVLLMEVVRDTSDSENDSSSDSDDETIEDSVSDKSTVTENDSICARMNQVLETTCDSADFEKAPETSDDATNNNVKVKAKKIINHRVMLNLQKGARYELDKRQLKEAFSKFGKVIRMIFNEETSGSVGFIDFRTTHSAIEATNQVVRAGKCLIHTTLPMNCLSEVPVPYQIFLESRYLPRIWEKEIVLRSFFAKYGDVTGVLLWGRKGVQRCIISFKEAVVAQNLIGTTVKILTCTVVIKEVSSNTVGADSAGRKGETIDATVRGVGVNSGGGDARIP